MDYKFNTYDLETLSQCFTAIFKDFDTGKYRDFVIHESRNDLEKLVKFLKALKKYNYWLVGFNCNTFDGQVLEFILRNYDKLKHWSSENIAREIYTFAQKIILLPKEERFNNLLPVWKFLLPHIDIFKQKHYDGKQKSCSLKWLEFTMRFPSIESMPIHHSSFITTEQIPLILKYNRNDVDATEELFRINMYETEMRFKLSEEYDLNLINASEPRLTRDIQGKFLSEAMGIPYRELKERKTYRNSLCGKDLIFDYVRFKDPDFQAVKDFYEALEFNPARIKEDDQNLEKISKTFRWANLSEVVVGLGGLHGCVGPGVYTSRPGWKVRDIDGTSYYPNLGIKNKIYPEHLSEIFCEVNELIFNLRQTFDKKDPRNRGLKTVINTAYGLTNQPDNFLYDPKYSFMVTINGQLLLLMLAQRLKEKIKSVIFYQFNTDGITIGYNEEEEPLVNKCMNEWQKLTKINLEDKFYDKMIIMDVNNYIAVDTKGNVKRKGRFGYSMKPEDNEMLHHKNPSILIVPKAIEAYFLKGIPVEKTIRECEDIYDFCIGKKVKKDFTLIREYYDYATQTIKKEEIDQTVVRFYVSKEASKLRKAYKKGTKLSGRKVEAVKGWNQTYFNEYVKKEMKDYNINYAFYIQRARETIDLIEPNAKNTKLW